MKFFKVLVTVLLIALAATGCQPKKRNPDPSMTAVGSGMNGAGGSGDSLNPTGVDGLNGAGMGGGLESRDGANAGNIEANYDRGILQPVYFDFDQYTVRSSDRDTLQAAADYMKANPKAKVLVIGYCDWRGTTEYNMSLGDRRASSVKQYLTDLGIDAARFETLSKGDLEAKTEAGDSEMSQDRRSELLVSKDR